MQGMKEAVNRATEEQIKDGVIAIGDGKRETIVQVVKMCGAAAQRHAIENDGLKGDYKMMVWYEED